MNEADTPDRPLSVLLCLASAGVLGYVLHLSDGHYDETALILVGVAVLLGTLAVVAPALGSFGRRWEALLLVLGAGLVAWQVSLLLYRPPGIYLKLDGPTDLQPFVVGLVCGAMLTGAILLAPGRLRRRVLVPLLLLVYLLLGVWLIRSTPSPWIDLFVIHQDSVDALLAGANPYAIDFPNIYGDVPYYAPELVEGGRTTFGYTYPPLSLLLSVAGKVLGGDYRYSLLLATVGAAALLAYARRGRLGAVAAAVLLFAPRGFFVLEQGWTDAYVLLLAAGTIFAACRSPRAMPWVLGLLLASKQYALLAAPAAVLLVARPWTLHALWRTAWRAGLAALAVTVPFVLASPEDFFHSTVVTHLKQPFRFDGLTFLAPFARETGRELSAWPAPLLAIAVAALSLWRAARTPSGFAATAALTLLVFFSVNKQAFANYYFLAMGLFACAVAAARPGPEALEPEDGSTHDAGGRIPYHPDI